MARKLFLGVSDLLLRHETITRLSVQVGINTMFLLITVNARPYITDEEVLKKFWERNRIEEDYVNKNGGGQKCKTTKCGTNNILDIHHWQNFQRWAIRAHFRHPTCGIKHST